MNGTAKNLVAVGELDLTTWGMRTKHQVASDHVGHVVKLHRSMASWKVVIRGHFHGMGLFTGTKAGTPSDSTTATRKTISLIIIPKGVKMQKNKSKYKR